MKYKKQIRIPAIIIIALILVISGVHFGLQGWLNKQLPELLNKNPHRKYNITYAHTNLNLIQQNLVIKDVNIIELNDSVKASTIRLKTFKVINLHLQKLFFNKEIETQNLIVENPVFNITVHQDKIDQKEEKVNEIWTDIFTRISIKNLEIRNAIVKLINVQDSLPELEIDNLDLKIKGFAVDTTTLKNPLPLNFKQIAASCFNTKIRVDTIGLLKIEKISLTDKSVKLLNSSLQPSMTQYEFLDVERKKDDWFTFDMNKLALNDFSWSFSTDGVPIFKASSFQLDSIVMHSLTDKRYPKEHNGYKPLLAEIFRSLPVKFQLDSFRVVNSAIYSETRPANNDTTGIAYFDNLFVSGYNLHNNSELIQDTEFDILCRFMGQATMKARYTMNVNDMQDRFRLKGNLKNLTTESVNKILQPLADIETAGQLYGIDFDILADNKQSTGTVDFEYNNLKIKVMNRSTSKKNVIISALSNLALRRSNVRSDKNFRQGRIKLERDPEKSIFGYVWDSVKDGLMDTLVPFNINWENQQSKRKKRKG